MPETGLGLEQLPVADEMGGHRVTETVQRRTFDAGGDTERRNLCDRASAVRNVALAGVGANNQSSTGAGPLICDHSTVTVGVGRSSSVTVPTSVTLSCGGRVIVSLDGQPTANTIMLKMLDQIYTVSPLH